MNVKDYVIQATINAIHSHTPSYRIWIDGELMCERTFWPDPRLYLIRETMHVLLDYTTHAYRFELTNPTHGIAWTHDITIIDEKSNQKLLYHKMKSLVDNNYQELKFTINSEEIINEI